MARLRHRKARLVRKVRCPNYTGFLLTCQIPLKALTHKGYNHISKSKLSLNNKYKEKHPKNPHFCPLFRCLFLIFHPSQFVMIFSNARFRVSHSRNKNRVVALLGFSRLGFLWELVIREERFWNFIVVSSLVDTRSAFPEIT